MTGCFGDNPEDRSRARELDQYLESGQEGSNEQRQEQIDELVAQINTVGQQPQFIASLSDILIETVVDDSCPDSELSAIIMYSLQNPGDSDIGARLNALVLKHLGDFVDTCPDEVIGHLNPQQAA